MDKENFFIKQGYKNQSKNWTLSTKKGDLYWTRDRIRASFYYQYETYKLARSLITKHELKSVVDVGCGVAVKLMRVVYPACKDVTGIDQEEAIDYCNAHYSQGKFLVDNFEKPKLSPGKFDLVICADVIEHMSKPDSLLAYIKKLSIKGGYIIVSTPERDVLRGKDCMSAPKAEHVREWNKKELAKYLSDRKFRIISHQTIPIAKATLFNPTIRKVRRQTLKETGTVNVNQLVVCQLRGKI